MSHSVTVTRTTTTTTTTAILLNSGLFKTVPGLLKLAQTILGAVAVGLIANYGPRSEFRSYSEYIYFYLMAVTFLIATAVNLFSCLLSIATATILPKTMFELMYHFVAFVLYVAAAVALIVLLDKYGRSSFNNEPMMAAAVIGLVNSALYLISAVYSYRSYRGL